MVPPIVSRFGLIASENESDMRALESHRRLESSCMPLLDLVRLPKQSKT